MAPKGPQLRRCLDKFLFKTWVASAVSWAVMNYHEEEKEREGRQRIRRKLKRWFYRRLTASLTNVTDSFRRRRWQIYPFGGFQDIQRTMNCYLQLNVRTDPVVHFRSAEKVLHLCNCYSDGNLGRYHNDSPLRTAALQLQSDRMFGHAHVCHMACLIYLMNYTALLLALWYGDTAHSQTEIPNQSYGRNRNPLKLVLSPKTTLHGKN